MLLIKNGNLITMENRNYDKADILIDSGKIIKIDECIIPNDNIEIIDVKGNIVLPGFVDAHCHIGVFEDGMKWEGEDGCEEGNPITPQMRALDCINPMDQSFKEAYQEGGVTSAAVGPGSAGVVCGQFCAIKTYGNVVDEMLIKESVGMKIALGENSKDTFYYRKESPMTRMGLAAYLREIIFKALEYRKQLEVAEKKGTKKPKYDIKLEEMQKVINREIPLKVHAHRADDIATAIRIANEFNLRMTLDHCTEGHLIVEHLLRNKQYHPIVGPSLVSRPKVELKNLTFKTPGILSNAGLEIAICTDHNVVPLKYLPLCAALAVKAGMKKEEALKAITIYPAKLLDLDERIGSLKEGKDADIVVWNGDPFDIYSEILYTIINGKVVYNK